MITLLVGIKSLKMSFIMFWKVAGEFVRLKKHYGGFEKTSVGDEGSFPLITFVNLYVFIAPTHVKLCEDFSVLEFVHELGN